MLTTNLFILRKSVNYSVNLFSNRNINSAYVLKSIGHIFIKVVSVVAFWDRTRMNASGFWIKRLKLRSWWVQRAGKCTFGPLMQCLESYWTEFHQLSALMHFGTRMNASIIGAKRSKVKVIALPRVQQVEAYRALCGVPSSNF